MMLLSVGTMFVATLAVTALALCFEAQVTATLDVPGPGLPTQLDLSDPDVARYAAVLPAFFDDETMLDEVRAFDAIDRSDVQDRCAKLTAAALSALRFGYRYFRYSRVRRHARAEGASPALLIGRAADVEVQDLVGRFLFDDLVEDRREEAGVDEMSFGLDRVAGRHPTIVAARRTGSERLLLLTPPAFGVELITDAADGEQVAG